MRARLTAARIALAVAAGVVALLVTALAASGAQAPRAERAAGTRSSTTGEGEPRPAPKLSPSSAGTISRRLSVAAIPSLHEASSTTVTVVSFQYKPSSVTVSVGDTVTWKNNDPVEHTATKGGSFDVDLPAHGSGTHTFNQAGTFDYICKIHPNMKASVTVTSGSSGGGSSPGGSGTSNGNGGSSGTGSSGSSPSSGTSSGSSSNPLPHTGLQLASLIVTGLALLGLGLVLRRGVRYPTR